MLNPKNLANDQEQYESFTNSRDRKLVQYDYRAANGEFFSCVKKSLDDCRHARDEWRQKDAAR